MRIFIFIIIFWGFTLSQLSEASEIGVILQSKHFDTNRDYNESNLGLYAIHDGFIAGTYKNSYNTQTTFVGAVNAWKYFSLSYGVSHGYGWDGKALNDPAKYGARLLLFVMPTVILPLGDYRVNAHIVGNAVALSISITL